MSLIQQPFKIDIKSYDFDKVTVVKAIDSKR